MANAEAGFYEIIVLNTRWIWLLGERPQAQRPWGAARPMRGRWGRMLVGSMGRDARSGSLQRKVRRFGRFGVGAVVGQGFGGVDVAGRGVGATVGGAVAGARAESTFGWQMLPH
jgi:hypothetical protein